jgi:hypothetical protein
MKRFWQVGLMALAMLAVMPTTQAQPSGGDPPEFSCEDLTYLIGSYQGSIDHINDQIASATASRDYWVTEAANRIARKVQLQTVEIPAAQAAYDAQVAYWEWCVSYHGHESQTTYDAMVLKGQLKRALDDLIEEMADLDGTQTNSESMAYAQHKVWIYNNILATHQSYMTHLLAQLALAQQMYEDQNCGGGGLLSVPPETQPLAPVADPMFSPEEASEAGAVKTLLAAGAYLNSDAFARSLIALPATMAPVGGGAVGVLNQTNCHVQVWRDASSLDPPGTNDYPTLPPGADTRQDAGWEGDSVDFVRINCVWYKLRGDVWPWPSDIPLYRIIEIPCGSGNFKVQHRIGFDLYKSVWSDISPHPCGDPIPWYLGGGYVWCPPDPVPGPCSPAHDPECEDCEGGDPDPPGGGELP